MAQFKPPQRGGQDLLRLVVAPKARPEQRTTPFPAHPDVLRASVRGASANPRRAGRENRQTSVRGCVIRHTNAHAAPRATTMRHCAATHAPSGFILFACGTQRMKILTVAVCGVTRSLKSRCIPARATSSVGDAWAWRNSQKYAVVERRGTRPDSDVLCAAVFASGRTISGVYT